VAQAVARGLRRAAAGLADLHVDDVAARLLGGAGGLHHVHHDKGIDLGSG
jgi:hypothetical protein